MTWEVRAYPARCARAPFALRKGRYFLNWHQSPLGAALRQVPERVEGAVQPLGRRSGPGVAE